MKYIVSGYLTISVVAEIQANSEIEAREKANNLVVPSLCHQCVSEVEDGCWVLNGFDDVPDDAVQDVEAV